MSQSKEPDEGGTAFPAMTPGGYGTPGMTLRDWFAGHALTGVYAAWMADCRDANSSSAHMAQECYMIADAMIAARNFLPEQVKEPKA